MRTFETEKHNIPEGATHYQDETRDDNFAWIKGVGTESFMVKMLGEDDWDVERESLYIDDIKPIPQQEIEWENGLPPVGSKVMCSYTETDCDGWCDMHGPSDVIAYHGDYVWIAHHGKFNRVHELCNIEFEKPESPDEKERLEAAYDLYCEWVGDCIGFHAIDFKEWLVEPDYFRKWLRVVDKTGYRKTD